MKKTGLLLIIGAVASIVSACDFREEKQASAGQSSDIQHVGFAEVRDQVIVPRCLGCHTTKSPSLSTYAEVKAKVSEIRNAVFVSQNMPKDGPLTHDQASLLQGWLDDGAPEFAQGSASSSASAPTPEATPPAQPVFSNFERPVTYEALTKNVLNLHHCLNCHRSGNTHGLADLTDVAAVRKIAASLLTKTLTPDPKPMPPAPDTLSVTEKEMISAWVIDGMRSESDQ